MPTSDPGHALLRTRALVVGYLGRALLPRIDLSIHPGEIWALVGRNGSGKSTLLKTLLGLLPAVGGEVERRGGLRIGWVPQRSDFDQTVPARVIDVVGGGLDRGWSFLDPTFVRRHKSAIELALADTDTTALIGRQFAALSEGQKQRVLLARALVSDPELLVLDEPTSAMDGINERSIFEVLNALRVDRHLGLLMASHQLSFVPDFATHAAFVDADERTAIVGEARTILSAAEFRAHYGVVRGTGDLEPGSVSP